jgi:hypothetical protein
LDFPSRNRGEHRHTGREGGAHKPTLGKQTKLEKSAEIQEFGSKNKNEKRYGLLDCKVV